MAVIAPIIHLNGDRKATLVAQLEDVYRTLRAASVALQACAPNGRNYYLEDGLFPKAQRQHWGRMAHITTVIDSILEEVKMIQADASSRS